MRTKKDGEVLYVDLNDNERAPDKLTRAQAIAHDNECTCIEFYKDDRLVDAYNQKGQVWLRHKVEVRA